MTIAIATRQVQHRQMKKRAKATTMTFRVKISDKQAWQRKALTAGISLSKMMVMAMNACEVKVMVSVPGRAPGKDR